MLRGAANLHQRVKRHDEEAAENTEHHQVEKHSPDRRNAEQRQQLVRAVTDQPDRRGEIEINAEQRQANRAERHQADFDMLARHPLAEQRTEADTQRENSEQQRHRRLAATQHILGIGRELGEKERAVQPEPRNTENGQKHRPIAAGEIDVVPGFGNGIEVDLQPRIGRWRRRNIAAGQVTQHRDQQAADSNPHRLRHGTGKQTAGQRADQNGDKRTSLDQRIAADQFIRVQMLRQDGKFDRPE